MKEIWKTISDFNNYEVSNLGNIRNITTGKVLKSSDNGRGYLKVILYQNNKKYTKKIHRLVAEAFLENPENLPQINHIDECKTNNSIENLEWCSCIYNNNYGTRNERASKTLKKSRLSNQNPMAKRVKCVETAEVFECTADAARKYNLRINSVSNAANPNHTQKTAGGYTWCYV